MRNIVVTTVMRRFNIEFCKEMREVKIINNKNLQLTYFNKMATHFKTAMTSAMYDN